MGIFASLLVFIAFVITAKIILPYITETVKIALMFVSSIALTVTGYVLSRKNPKNTFFAALLACGTACVYLSIVVTKVHFAAISPIVMYVLLAIWAGVIVFLGRSREDWMFFVIGNLGFIVSTFFAIELPDASYIIPLLIYIVVVACAYQIAFWKNDVQKGIQSIVNALALVVFECVVTDGYSGLLQTYIVVAVTLTVIIVQFVIYLFADLKEYNPGHFVFAVINLPLLLIAFIAFALSTKLSALVIVLSLFSMAAVMEVANMLTAYKTDKTDVATVNAVFSAFIFAVAAVLSAINNEIFFDYGIMLLLFALVSVYGILSKNMIFKAQGWAMVVYCMLLGASVDSGTVFEITALVITVAAFVAEAFVFDNSVIYKMISYLQLGAWMFYMLYKFKTPDFVISVCMIFFAVICIVLGFWKRDTAKSLRIFGLVLTIIFVVKFIVVDISFDSSITKALSFLAAGILCFGISAIYNHFEKQGQNAG